MNIETCEADNAYKDVYKTDDDQYAPLCKTDTPNEMSVGSRIRNLQETNRGIFLES